MSCKLVKRDWEALLYNYNLTEYAFKTLLVAQNYSCKICLIPDGKSKLHVDHCHISGKVRGLLCGHCNKMLGLAKENTTTLLKSIQYLKGKL